MRRFLTPRAGYDYGDLEATCGHVGSGSDASHDQNGLIASRANPDSKL